MSDAPDFSRKVSPTHTTQLVPSYGQPWFSSESASILTGAYHDFVINFSGTDYLYYVDSIIPYCSGVYAGMFVLYFNTSQFSSGSFEGAFHIPVKDNPSLYYLGGDSLTIRIYNLTAGTLTYGYALTGTKFPRPSGFGRAPAALFTLAGSVGHIPLSVPATDASLNSPTSWEWYADGVSVQSVLQNPTLSYPVAGSYSPKLKATNVYGYDLYSVTNLVKALNFIDLSGFTETDPSSRLVITGDVITFTGLQLSEVAYVYKDYGANHFDSYDFYFKAVLTAGSGTVFCAYIMLSANYGPVYTGAGLKLFVNCLNSGGSTLLQLSLYNGSTSLAADSYTVVGSVNHYCRLVHASGSTTATLYIYSDSNFTVLVDTLVITHASVATLFRYLSFAVSDEYSAAGSATGSVTVLGSS